MYAGKTSKLISMYNQITDFNKVIIDYDIVEHAMGENKDYVMKGNLESHDKIIIPNVHRCKKLNSLYKKENYMLFSDDVLNYYYDIFQDSKYVFINECQFFDDLKQFVLDMLSYGKHVFLYGLDGDYKQNLMGQTMELIPYATTIEKITGKCSECKSKSIVSHRTIKNNNIYLPDANAYVPLCLNCYDDKKLNENSASL